ncbi:guided entry of tail-anchored proteins factor 1 isoform X2 [Nematostella vectensis]|uniref:guided entry of tail-anchored proteins factor 1 isoform X2 n=1 Tax=Nematostella vectensis TaxID=45351 RepID=UPI00138FA0A6|nr:guided entry of tail-anchored proteins factor 1 isoform X2 [Nematostella vectensis]
MADELFPMTVFCFVYVLLMRTVFKSLLAASSWDEFARFVRLKRKIDKVSEDLIEKAKSRNEKIGKQQRSLKGIFLMCLFAVHIVFLVTYRKTPIVQLPEPWFSPLHSIISFPTGTIGAIGLPFWMVTCNQIVSSYII